MSNTKTPCFGCANRAPMCHSVCNAYKEYKRDLLRRNRAIREEKAKESMTTEYVISSIKSTKRKPKKNENLGCRKGR